MAQVEGLTSLVATLREQRERAVRGGAAKVAVGFTAKSALYVHENMEPKTLGVGKPRPSGLGHYWGPADYGPKFLENPMREMTGDGTFNMILVQALRAGKTVAQGLLLVGLRLQREAQLRVPVEYGNLKASAFTRLAQGE